MESQQIQRHVKNVEQPIIDICEEQKVQLINEMVRNAVACGK